MLPIAASPQPAWTAHVNRSVLDLSQAARTLTTPPSSDALQIALMQTQSAAHQIDAAWHTNPTLSSLSAQTAIHGGSLVNGALTALGSAYANGTPDLQSTFNTALADVREAAFAFSLSSDPSLVGPEARALAGC